MREPLPAAGIKAKYCRAEERREVMMEWECAVRCIVRSDRANGALPDRRRGLVYNLINHFHCQIGNVAKSRARTSRHPALRCMSLLSLLDVS
jgi:hypothetical protein